MSLWSMMGSSGLLQFWQFSAIQQGSSWYVIEINPAFLVLAAHTRGRWGDWRALRKWVARPVVST